MVVIKEMWYKKRNPLPQCYWKSNTCGRLSELGQTWKR